MLTQELLVEIHVLHRQGKSIRAIAKALQISRNSVRKYLRNIAMTPNYSKRTDRASKLDPFKAYLKARIDAAKPDWIPATVLFREIQANGYEGKEGILKNYIRPFKITPDANRYGVLKRQRVNNYKLTLLLSAGGGANSKPLLPHWGTAGLPMFALANMSARKTGWPVLKVLYITLAVCPKSYCSIMPSAS